MKKYIVSIIILFIVILLSIGGYFIYSNTMNNKSNDVATLNEKCLSEIKSLDSNIISMMNDINNISYTNYKIVNEKISVSSSQQKSSENEQSDNQNSQSGGQDSSDSQSEQNGQNTVNSSTVINNGFLSGNNDNVDWTGLKDDIENMYDTWTTALIDLTTLNVNKDNLLKFSRTLDQIVTDLDSEDKKATLTHMADLYNLLTLYVNDFIEDGNEAHIYNVKSNILYADSFVEAEDWENVKKYIVSTKEKFYNILNNQVNNVNKIDMINKAYVLINELEEDCNNKNKKVFYINYSNLMQELENI